MFCCYPKAMTKDEHTPQSNPWPAITGACRPWTRWWWMGSAVTEAEITRHLRLFHEAGFGGVEISPIYGVSGAEARAIPFLGPAWVEMLRFTLRQARDLRLPHRLRPHGRRRRRVSAEL